MIDVLWLGGTGFPNGGDGVSETFAKYLRKDKFNFQIVPYPADYGLKGTSYPESMALGRQALIDAIEASPNKVIIGGYSQGAGIAGNLASETLPAQLEVLGCALVADPYRPIGAGMPGQPITGGCGIGGQRPITQVPTWWAANEGDPITAIPWGNPLRFLADMSEYFSLSSVADAMLWMADLIARAKSGRWQPQNWLSWRSWTDAVAYGRGYLFDGRHTDDYIIRHHAQFLAEVVNKI